MIRSLSRSSGRVWAAASAAANHGNHQAAPIVSVLPSMTAAARTMSTDRPQAKFFPKKKTPMLPKDTYEGKVVFITGGGTGLGKGMATMFSKLGAKVVIVARRLPVLQETAKEISAETGNAVHAVHCDIRDPAQIKAAVDDCVATFGLPNVVINNAAGNFISPTERLSPNAFKTIVDIVLNGAAFTTLDIGKRMIEAQTGGVFLSITTTYTYEGTGYTVPSACAKSGVEAMMKSLGSEWGKYGIRMNCIAPGPVETDGAFSRLDPSGQFREVMADHSSVGRFGEVEEIANLATFMCSDFASWMTSETVVLDGGEFRQMAGEFNGLRVVSPDQWEMMAKMIRETNKKSKK